MSLTSLLERSWEILITLTENMRCIEIEEAVARYFGVLRNLIVPNISWGLWLHECDLLIVTKSGYATEVEIKVSRADLRKDFEKKHGHNDRGNRIKRFYYAVPDNLVPYAQQIVPESAGIIGVKRLIADSFYTPPNKTRAYIVRDAPVRKCRPLTPDEMNQVARLGCMRIWGLKKKLIKALGLQPEDKAPRETNAVIEN